MFLVSTLHAHLMFLQSPYVYPARLQDGTDGMVRVVADGTTSRELEILRFLSSAEVLSNPENHTIPVLGVLYFDKWQFVVFPLVGTDPCRPWFNRIAEAVDCIGQTLEVRDTRCMTKLLDNSLL
jgi:hypothetical protein